MPRLAPLRMLLSVTVLTAFLAVSFGFMGEVHAQSTKIGPSGLPLPRFVSLKSNQVNMRVGPGTDYKVEWTYVRRGLPLEIIQEFYNWRHVRDADGAEGWIHQSLLSGHRTGLIAPWREDERLPLLADPQENARKRGEVQSGALGDVLMCDGTWCRMRFGNYVGWIGQDLIWGVYPGEVIED